jgi:ABC-type polysaccharide/polyol phosphate export permease
MTQHLFLLREMVRRDFQGRYAGSALGLVWSFAQPLWLLLLYHFVFQTVLKVSLAFERTEHFAVFLFCGLLPWNAVHEGVLRSATAVTDNASLVKKLRFPSELLVVAVVLTALLHEAIAAALFVAVLVALGELTWSGLPLLLAAIPLQAALTLGLGLVLASLQVFFRDIVQFLGMAMTGWFFLTPIVYPVAQVPEPFRGWIELNPLTALVGLYRQALVGGEPHLVPGTGALAAAAAAILVLGAWLFRRLRPGFADEI